MVEKEPLSIAQNLNDRGGLDLRECFIDGRFIPAKKRRRCVGPTKLGKVTRLMAKWPLGSKSLRRFLNSNTGSLTGPLSSCLGNEPDKAPWKRSYTVTHSTPGTASLLHSLAPSTFRDSVSLADSVPGAQCFRPSSHKR